MKSKRKILLTLLSMFTIGGLVGCSAVNDDFDDEEVVEVPEDKYYLLSFANFDSSFLFSSYVKEGDYSLENVYSGVLPTKADDSVYTYSFNGWECDNTRYEHSQVIHVNKNYSFTALYSTSLLVYHSVQFINYDGELLYEVEVKDGEDATYLGEIPTRPNSDGNTFTFSGWNRDTTNITADTIFVAQYSSTREKYRVRFLNYDGSILDIQYVYYGDGVQYTGETPIKPAEGEYSYTFTGWDNEGLVIKEDTDFTAQFEENYRELVVTFVNYDGSKLYETTTTYGGSVEYDPDLPDPTRPAEGRNDFEFTGWNVPLDKVYANIEVKAQYKTVDRHATEGLSISFDYDNLCYKVTGYTGNETDIFIPKKYDDGSHGEAQVGRIGYGAFQYKTNIQSIFIEDNVTVIEGYAFAYCYNLKTLRLPLKLRTLGSYVFAQTVIENMTLPSTLENVQIDTFYDYMNAYQVTTDPKNLYITIEDTLMYNKEKTILLGSIVQKNYYSTHRKVTIAEGIEIISSGVFNSNEYIEEIVFPSTLTTIQSEAFYNCTALKKINLEDCTSLTSIGYQAFYNCYNLESVEFPEALTSLGEWAFASCNNLVSVTFNDCELSIPNYAFVDCYNLVSLELGSKITEIRYGAFGNSQKLGDVTLPKALQNIDSNAFYNCSNIKSFTIDEENDYFYIMDGVLMNNSNSEIAVYPYGKNGTFRISADFVGTIDGSWVNYGFTTLEIDENNTKYKVEDNVVYSKDKTRLFFGSKCPETLTVPSTVTSISNSAFSSSSNLRTIDLSQTSLTSLPYWCFGNCGYLTTVIFPDTIERFENYCFYNCYSSEFKQFTIPDSVTEIGQYCFGSSYNLEEVIVGSGVTSIPDSCFNYCNNLKNITFRGSPTSFGSYAFYYTNFSSFDMPDSVSTIDSYCFQECDSLTSVELSQNLKRIEYGVFYGCDALSSITFPSSLEYIGSEAFRFCYQLSGEVVIPDSVKTTGTYCFGNCRALQSVVIGNGLTTLGGYSFYHCSSLSSVTIGASLTTLPTGCFSYCSSLTAIDIPSNIYQINTYCFRSTGLRSITIPSTVTYIGSNCFYDCRNTVVFCTADVSGYDYDWIYNGPTYYTNINGGLYSDDGVIYLLSTSNKVSVSSFIAGGSDYATIPSTVTINGHSYDVETIAEDAFAYSWPTWIDIEEGLKNINSGAFTTYQTHSFNVVLPQSIESISTNSHIDYAQAIYYRGSEQQFVDSGLSDYIANNFMPVTVYFYSETIPTTEEDGHKQWRYLNGVPTIWDTYLPTNS